MIKPIDPSLKAAYDQWGKSMPDNYVKHGAMLFITSLEFIRWTEAYKKKSKTIDVRTPMEDIEVIRGDIDKDMESV